MTNEVLAGIATARSWVEEAEIGLRASITTAEKALKYLEAVSKELKEAEKRQEEALEKVRKT